LSSYVSSSDKVRLTLTTLKNLDAAKTKTLEHKCFLYARLTSSHWLLFVNPGVHLDQSIFSSLTTVAVCHMQGLW